MGLTTRDLKFVRYLEKNFILNAEIASRLIYWTKNEKSSLNVAHKRTKEIISQQKQVKRVRQYVGQSYVYYIGKNPTKITHRLMMSDLLSRMVADGFEIILDETELEFKGLESKYHIRPDMLVTFKYGNETYSAFVEIDLTKEFTNSQAYNRLFADIEASRYTIKYPALLISVCDNKPDLPCVWIKTDWSNFSNLKYVFIS
ncbi:MAG: hypothetical protein J6D33_06700 [Turicibacter sp.]|nr:hypothetical protein [Turicibacter sp.]